MQSSVGLNLAMGMVAGFFIGYYASKALTEIHTQVN